MVDSRLEILLTAKDMTSGAFTKVQRRAADLSTQIFSLQGAMSVMAGAAGVGAVTSIFLDAATTTENFQTRLSVLLGSVEKGNQLFDEMATYAGKVPFEYEKVMQSATQLAGVMKGGVSEIKEWMPLIGDLAATSGLSIETATEQISRMYSSGAASADMFRERGILSMLGFQAGVSYSAEETRTKLMEAWKDPASQFAGATAKMADDWSGMSSMMGDHWFSVRKMVMDAGVFDLMKGEFKDLLTELDRLKEDGTLKDWAQEAADYVGGTAEAIGNLKDKTAGLISVLDAAGPSNLAYGLVGARLLGSQPGALIYALLTANDYLEKFNLHLGSLKVDDSFWEPFNNLMDVFSGKKDWHTGATLLAESLSQIQIEADEFAASFTDAEAALKKATEEAEKNTEAVSKNAQAHAEATELIENGYGNMFDGVTAGMGQMDDAWGDTAHGMGLDWQAAAAVIDSTWIETTNNMEVVGNQAWDSMGQALDQNLTGAFQREFTSIGGFFEDLLDNMYSMFGSWASKITSQ